MASLHASSVVVVGPGTDAGGTLPGRLASRVLAELLVGDPSVVVHAVGVPGDPPVPVHARLADVPGPVELAVVAVPAGRGDRRGPRPRPPRACAGSSC